jgi:hypothetical protein
MDTLYMNPAPPVTRIPRDDSVDERSNMDSILNSKLKSKFANRKQRSRKKLTRINPEIFSDALHTLYIYISKKTNMTDLISLGTHENVLSPLRGDRIDHGTLTEEVIQNNMVQQDTNRKSSVKIISRRILNPRRPAIARVFRHSEYKNAKIVKSEKETVKKPREKAKPIDIDICSQKDEGHQTAESDRIQFTEVDILAAKIKQVQLHKFLNSESE